MLRIFGGEKEWRVELWLEHELVKSMIFLDQSSNRELQLIRISSIIKKWIDEPDLLFRYVKFSRI